MSNSDWRSPYHATQVKGRYMLYYVHRSILPHVNDSVYEVVDQWVNRPDLMALDLYGDPDLWIVFGVRNALKDPCYDLTLGRQIIVPPLEHVLRSLA